MGAYKGSSHGMTIVFERFFNWSKAWFANSPMRVWPVDDVDEAVVSEGRTDKLSFDRSCHLFRKPFNSVPHFNRFEGFSATPTSKPSSGKSSDSKEHSSSSVPKSLRPSEGFEDSLFSALQKSRLLMEKLIYEESPSCSQFKLKGVYKSMSKDALFPPGLSLWTYL